MNHKGFKGQISLKNVYILVDVNGRDKMAWYIGICVCVCVCNLRMTCPVDNSVYS